MLQNKWIVVVSRSLSGSPPVVVLRVGWPLGGQQAKVFRYVLPDEVIEEIRQLQANPGSQFASSTRTVAVGYFSYQITLTPPGELDEVAKRCISAVARMLTGFGVAPDSVQWEPIGEDLRILDR